MQRPGWDPADPPSPSPWAAPPDDAGRTRVADDTTTPPPEEPAAYPAGTGPYAAGPQPAGPDPAGPDPAGPYPAGPYTAGPYPAGPYPGPYPAGPYGPGDGGWPPPRPPHQRSWPPSRREVRTALATLVGLALLGAALALLWLRVAPRLEFKVDEPGRAVPVVPEAEEYVAADGRFVLITLAAGVVAGLLCWLLRGSRGPLVLTALALGGLLGAVVTWRLGVWLGPGYHPQDLQDVGRTVAQPLDLRARAALVVEPIAAVLVYLLGAGFTVHNDLGVDRERPRPVS